MNDAQKRLADAMRERRDALGLTQEEAARAGGISKPNWEAIENYRSSFNFRGPTRRAIAKALGWVPDAVPRILDGEDPADLIDQTADLRTGASSADREAELLARVEALEASSLSQLAEWRSQRDALRRVLQHLGLDD